MKYSAKMERVQLNMSPVFFNSENHTYKIGDKYLKGVTSTLLRRAYPNTYTAPSGMNEEQWNATLRRAAAKGTAVHQTIELYEDLGIEADTPELLNYIAIKDNNGFTNIATEYIVSDEEHYASAIDHVWISETGEIVLVDIKHTFSIHEEEVACQLSIYKRFFEKQNPHLKVGNIALLWLRGNKMEFKFLHPLADEILDALIHADLKDEMFDIQQHYGELPVKFAEVEEHIAFLEADIKEKISKYNELKTGLLSLMIENGVKKFTGTKVMLTVTSPSKRKVFDTTAFKHDHADLYEQYKTITETKSSLRITIKN